MPQHSADEKRNSDSGTGADAATTKLRRAHRRSRHGCWECKRRHMKCDENRPACSNCTISRRTCSFPPSNGLSTAPTAQSPTFFTAPVPAPAPASTFAESSTSLSQNVARTTSNSRVQSCSDSTLSGVAFESPLSVLQLPSFGSRSQSPPTLDDHAPASLIPPYSAELFAPTGSAESPLSSSLADSLPSFSLPIYTSNHLKLLHHIRSFLPFHENLANSIIDIVIDWAEEAPYAMDQLLAISADHFALVQPENAVFYRQTATELQIRALGYINDHLQGTYDPDTHCLPRFIFSSLLSIHLFYDTFKYYRATFHLFIERFISSVHVHCGVRSVVSDSYSSLLDSPLHSILFNVQEASDSRVIGDECTGLLEVIQNSDLGVRTVDACVQATYRLQWVFDTCRNLPQGGNTHTTRAFLVLLTKDYIEAVRKLRPEALLVLAYYGVLLHRSRQDWTINDSGEFLIRVIADYLGSFWQDSMRWPLKELAKD